MDTIDVFSSSSAFHEEDVRDKIVVVIDVLRACSTIQTALENGASEVIPVSETEDPGKYIRNLDSSGLLLCGEKGGKKVEGFHLGNSPSEYVKEVVQNKTLIFKTSNGTRAITRSHLAREILIGSFLNLSALVDYLKEHQLRDIMLVCSGWKNRLSIEDLLCAGAITYHLYDKKIPGEAMDGAKVAFGLYEKFGKKVPELIASSNHANRLRELGFGDDLRYCARIDLFKSIPVMHDGLITITHQ